MSLLLISQICPRALSIICGFAFKQQTLKEDKDMLTT